MNKTSKILSGVLVVVLSSSAWPSCWLFAAKASNEMSDRLRVCGSLLGSFIHFLAPPALQPNKLRSYLEESALATGSLRDDQIEILSEIYRYTGNWRPGVENFLAGIRSPRHLEARLQWELSAIRKVRADELTISHYLEFRGFDEVRNTWKRLQKRGWSVQVVRGRFSERVYPVKLDFNRKVISISLALGFHPKPILLALHLRYADLFLSVHESSSRLKGLISQVEGAYDEKRYSSENDFLSKMIRYVIAREAVLRTIQDYSALVEEHPFFQVNAWAYLRASVDRATIDEVLIRINQDRSMEQRKRDWQMALAGDKRRSVQDVVRAQLRDEIQFLHYFRFSSRELDALRRMSIPHE